MSAPQALRDLQAFYRSTGSQRLRAALAVEFAEAVRSGSAGRRLTDAQSILAQVGLMQLWGSTSADQWFALEAASEAWDAEHGARWRRLHDAALPDDPDDEGDAMCIIGGEEPPDPPGWHLLSASG